MSLWLTEDELYELTGKKHRSKQIAGARNALIAEIERLLKIGE